EFERPYPPSATAVASGTPLPKSNRDEGIESNVYFTLAPMGRGARGEGVPDPSIADFFTVLLLSWDLLVNPVKSYPSCFSSLSGLIPLSLHNFTRSSECNQSSRTSFLRSQLCWRLSLFSPGPYFSKSSRTETDRILPV